ncbi:hypothetical protein BJF90_24060 [Pseudonocardia sp. CNS-004]|nr:hypothetical protein BJF90_24060 [Pseudonocardia sp. CNS-004]
MRPHSAASSTASEDGADTAASTGTPAITAFCASSNDARPDTTSTPPFAGIPRCMSAQPSTLSTALCRPTSSRTTIGSPAAVKSPAACSPPVLSKTRCRSRSTSGSAATTSGSTCTGSSAGEWRVRRRTASSDALPHTPHDEVV